MPQRHPRESNLTKILAVLLLLVAGALVFTVVQYRRTSPAAGLSIAPVAVPRGSDEPFGGDEQSTIDVFSARASSVVHITSLESRKNRITLDVSEIPQGTGTGFIWDDAGHVVTNFHVIAHGNRASVTLNDGSSYPATIVGSAPDKDLAVLKIDVAASKLSRILIGQSSKLKVGQKVLAIGNPFGLDQTLTTGVISGLGREIKSVSGRPIYDVIQTDASINPGNSGGPLLDSSGRLIGVNTAIYSPSGANAGIGFAVPVDTVTATVPQLIKYGKLTRPGLGINILADQIAAQQGIKGVVILGVAPGGAAEQAGIVGTQATPDGTVLGDVIVALDGTTVKTSGDLYKVLDAHKVGDEVDLSVEKDGKRRTVKVTLQALP
ncbi:MAG: trypsin-like peptidase domain-containing protein [Deltaproteobacteria bacterium]|nr:trypsin-like peptidase domain-containing protein [Deltaproteobacteria bacterium]